MTKQPQIGRLAVSLAWLHMVLFAAIAAACHVSPETAFGDAAWLPLARLAVLLLGACLLAVVIVLAGAALAGNARQMRTALLASLVIDAQVPVLLLAQPASVEYWHRDLGIAWFATPSVFLILVGVCVYAVLALGRKAKLTAS